MPTIIRLIVGLFILPLSLFANDNLPPIPDSINQKIAQAQSDSSRLRATFEKCIWTREYRQDIAENAYKEAIKQAEQVKDVFWQGKIESGLGVYYSFHLQYDQTLEHYYKALNLFETLSNKKEIAGVCHNIGMIMTRTKDNKQAMNFLLKAEKTNREIGNEAWLIKNYGEIGGIYQDEKQYDSAILYMEKAIKLSEKLKINRSIAVSKCNLGNLYIKMKEFAKAETLIRDAYKIAHENKFPPYNTSHTAMLLADVLQASHQLDEAEKYIKEAIQIKEQSHIGEQLDYCYDIYSELEEKRGNHQLALTYYKKYRNMRDSILTEEKEKTLSQYQIKYESEKKEKENSLLKKDNQIKQQQIYGLSSLILLLAAFIAYYYYSYKQKKQANDLISAQKQDLSIKNEQLNTLLLEKDNIIATVSHDYRSPLGRIRAISDILLLDTTNLTANQQKHIQKIPEILQEATHLIDDLMDVSHLDKLNLHLEKNIFSPQTVLENSLHNYQTWIEKKELQIETSFPTMPFYIETDQAAFQRIFDNLLSNSIKYTFPQTTIYIKVVASSDACTITIEDEGPGFSTKDKTKIFSPFQRLSARPIAVGTSYGLGLSIIKKLSESMGADIELLESKKGACFFWKIALQQPNE